MSSIIEGKITAVYQDEKNFFARFTPCGDNEFEFPITSEQFHNLKLNQETKLSVEFIV